MGRPGGRSREPKILGEEEGRGRRPWRVVVYRGYQKGRSSQVHREKQDTGNDLGRWVRSTRSSTTERTPQPPTVSSYRPVSSRIPEAGPVRKSVTPVHSPVIPEYPTSEREGPSGNPWGRFSNTRGVTGVLVRVEDSRRAFRGRSSRVGVLYETERGRDHGVRGPVEMGGVTESCTTKNTCPPYSWWSSFSPEA